MSALERNVAESVFLPSVATEMGLTGIAADRLIAAGDAACDSMDRGDSSRDVYIVVAGLLPELTEIEQPVGIRSWRRVSSAPSTRPIEAGSAPSTPTRVEMRQRSIPSGRGSSADLLIGARGAELSGVWTSPVGGGVL